MSLTNRSTNEPRMLAAADSSQSSLAVFATIVRRSSLMEVNMLVVSVRGHSPREWLAIPNHVYVGRRVALRNGKNAGQAWLESPLGNPFKPGRDLNPLAHYEAWLREMLAADTAGAKQVQLAFAALHADSVLGCWCAPGSCHADIIARIWQEMRPRA